MHVCMYAYKYIYACAAGGPAVEHVADVSCVRGHTCARLYARMAHLSLVVSMLSTAPHAGDRPIQSRACRRIQGGLRQR